MKHFVRLLCAALIASVALVSPLAQNSAQAAQSTATCVGSDDFSSIDPGLKVFIPTTSGGSRNCLLSAVQNGKRATQALQASLGGCYDRPLGSYGIDGAFGSYTTTALKWVQKNKAKVTADGIYGNKTHNKIVFAAGISLNVSNCASAPTNL